MGMRKVILFFMCILAISYTLSFGKMILYKSFKIKKHIKFYKKIEFRDFEIAFYSLYFDFTKLNFKEIVKGYFEILTLNKRYNILIFFGILVYLISYYKQFNEYIINLDLVVIGVILIFVGLVELLDTVFNGNFVSELGILFLCIIEVTLFIFVYVLEILNFEMSNYTFKIEFFVSNIVFLLIGLIIVVIYTLRLRYLKFLAVGVVLIYSIFIFIIFYGYTGYGYIIVNENHKYIKNLTFNVKNYNTNAINDIYTIVYYGISKSLNFDDIVVGLKGEVKQNLSIINIKLSLIAYVFNLVYFSILINIFSKILKKDN